MDDSPGMGGLEGVCNLSRDPQRLVQGQPPPFETLRERRAFDVLEHQRAVPVDLFEAVDAADVGVTDGGEETRFTLINIVARQCMHSLRKLGMRNEIDRFLSRLHTEVLPGASAAELRRKYAAKPDMWAAVLQTQLNLAAGWLHFGWVEKARPILDDARRTKSHIDAATFVRSRRLQRHSRTVRRLADEFATSAEAGEKPA